MFFSEEKNQKTFDLPPLPPCRAGAFYPLAENQKSFCFFFFRKRRFFSSALSFI